MSEKRKKYDREFRVLNDAPGEHGGVVLRHVG